jgi:hypothetical protein
VIRPPLPRDRTPETDQLRAIGNPWRRALLAFCGEPRSKRDVDREYLFVDQSQIRNGLRTLWSAGWLGMIDDLYKLDTLQPTYLRELVREVVGEELQEGEVEGDLVDAATAALARQSCRAVLGAVDSGEVLATPELMARTGLEQPQAHMACRMWARAGVLTSSRDKSVSSKLGRRWRRTGSVLPALGGFLKSLEVG